MSDQTETEHKSIFHISIATQQLIIVLMVGALFGADKVSGWWLIAAMIWWHAF